jgi:vitamin B12 transporter
MACDGVELSGRMALLDTLDWQVGVTRAVAALPGTDEQLRNRPRWTGSTQAVWRPRAAWQLSLGVVHVGKNLDSSIPTGDRELPAHTRVDGALEWRVLETLALRAALENALDADYEELVGFPGPRRGARLELRASL